MGAEIPLRNFSQVERGIEQALRNFAHAEVNGSELPAITAAEGIDKIGNMSALGIAEASETTANDIEQAGQAAVEIAAEIVKEAQQLAAGLRGNGRKMSEHLQEFAVITKKVSTAMRNTRAEVLSAPEHPLPLATLLPSEEGGGGFRTDEDGTPQKDDETDPFANNWEIEQVYAQILTHPGVPSVFWKHYFDWGPDLRNKIRALINARKVAGVHASSAIHLQSNAQAQGIYAARVVGRRGDLYVRIGGEDAQWQPANSNYQNYREYAQGVGWKVWVGIPSNPDVRQAPLKGALAVP